ncbi:hypothetical protein TUM20985_04670 [Mycobacterium antarcticum]|nr:hypothetical protein TUM20985_04670 [Mycolicibacterium sp. TUM20985]
MPLCESNQRPSVNGATADGSTGMPTDADRTAATTHPLLSAGATEAKDASPHIGAALRQRRGVDPVPPPESLRSCPPGSKKPTPHPSAFTSPFFCRRGEYDCTTSPYGWSKTRDETDVGSPSQAR